MFPEYEGYPQRPEGHDGDANDAAKRSPKTTPLGRCFQEIREENLPIVYEDFLLRANATSVPSSLFSIPPRPWTLVWLARLSIPEFLNF